MKPLLLGFLLTMAVCLVPNSASTQPHPGDVVWAQWKPNSWYHGRIDATCPGGLHVRFDDGDTACRPYSQIAVDRAAVIGVGVRVVAPWRNGRMYPGTVARRLAPSRFEIRFDDGGVGTAPASSLRPINR